MKTTTINKAYVGNRTTRLNQFTKLSIYLLLFILAGVTPALANAADIYLDPMGNDQSGDGSLQRPYRTLLGAIPSSRSVAPGTRIVLRGGEYDFDVPQNIRLIGTADAPITITAYEDESPRLDGLSIVQSGVSGGENRSVISVYNSRHVIVEKLEVIGSSGRGISYYDSEFVTIKDNKVHDVQSRAIGGSGAHIIIEGNTVWNGTMHHAGGDNNTSLTGFWAGAIQTYLRPGNIPSSDVIIRNNTVYNSWGEGIIAFWVDGAVISGNTVHDTYSVNIYIDHSRDVTVTGNHIYSTDSSYYRRGQPSVAVSIANEHYNATIDGILSTSDILISNNLMVGTRRGVSFWFDPGNTHEDNTYRNLTIANNTISNFTEMAIKTSPVGTRSANGIFRNNLIDAPSTTQTADLDNQSLWSFSNNNWVQGLPGISGEQNSIAKLPGYAGGSPENVENFISPLDSPNVGAGTSVPGVSIDYFGETRPSPPSIGFNEPRTPGVEPNRLIADFSSPSDATRWWHYPSAVNLNSDQGILQAGFDPTITYLMAGLSFTQFQNWSAHNGIQFRFKGTGTNEALSIQLKDNENERFEWVFYNDFSGWKEITVPFIEMTRRQFQPSPNVPNDGLTLTEVEGFMLIAEPSIALGAVPAEYQIDDIWLYAP